MVNDTLNIPFFLFILPSFYYYYYHLLLLYIYALFYVSISYVPLFFVF